MRRLVARFRVLLLAAVVVVSRRDAAAADESPLALPPFFVDEVSKGPPWRYGELAGSEILSRCPDYLTRQVVLAHHQLHRLLAEVLPPELQIKQSVPRTLLIYPEELQPAASQEIIARMTRSANLTAPPATEIDLPGRGLRISREPPRVTFLPNLRLWDRDCTAVFMIARTDGFDAERLALTTHYVNYLVRGRVPALQLWFTMGFLALYDVAQFDRGELVFPSTDFISREITAAVKRDPKTAPKLIPLAEFFSGRLPAREETLPPPAERWRAQATLFVRWGLDGKGAPRRAALWKLAERSALSGVTEELFRECFGLSFAEADAQLAVYLPQALTGSQRFRAPRISPPAVPLRPALEPEIARIKGDWERMEIAYVRALSPGLVEKYVEQARRTLRRAYEHNVRDPGMLAVMGLCEVDAGDDAAARPLLEAAQQRGPLRPRAAYELARLRLAALRAKMGDAGRGLSGVEAADILTPLFAARAGEPPFVEVYELIAEVWWLSQAAPSRNHLAVLDEGVRLFPRRSQLVQRAAELNLRHGFRSEAAALATIGVRTAETDEVRGRFEALRAQLEK